MAGGGDSKHYAWEELNTRLRPVFSGFTQLVKAHVKDDRTTAGWFSTWFDVTLC